ATLHSVQYRAAFAIFSLIPILQAEERPARIRVEVKANSAPVSGAGVMMNGEAYRSDANGVAILSAPLGLVEVSVTKEGYLPAKASLSIDQPRQWDLVIELFPSEQKEEITVHATRTGRRIQDSPLRVEVLDAEEIDEKTLMTPGDIVMMLNEMGGL